MALRINVNLFPKSGYYYEEADGTKLRGANWRAVIKKVKEYREENKLPVGNPNEDVVVQACRRDPQICAEAGRVFVQQPAVSLKATVLKWLNSFKTLVQKGDKLEFVQPSEAAERANICERCPFNKPLGVSSCSSCKQALIEFRKFLLGNKKQDSRLGGCQILGCDLQTATHLEELRVDNQHLPAHCWRKKSV